MIHSPEQVQNIDYSKHVGLVIGMSQSLIAKRIGK